MKSNFQFLLPLILTIISINSLKLTHNKAESTEINPVIIGDKKSEILPGTPKAMTLKNHFGAKPEDSPYGPQPTLIKKLVTTQYPDGSLKRENQTEIIHLQEGIISECDIAKQEFYPICFNLKSCDLCASNPYCGWCSSSQKCFPGKSKSATCATACFHSWVFNLQSCLGNVNGKMSNTAPEAMDLITPEKADPKIQVDTVITHPAVVKTPILLGKIIQNNENTKVDLNSGEILSVNKFNVEQPIVGEVSQVMNVETHHQQIINLENGKRLDLVQNKTMHGRENFAFKEKK